MALDAGPRDRDIEFATHVASALLGEPVRAVRPIVGRGTQNRIVVVTTDQTSVVVRMSDEPRALGMYEKERWCIEQAAAHGVPGPRVLAVGEVEQQAYMVQTLILGEPGNESGVARSHVWTELGRYATRIHAIPVGGFGDELADIITGRPDQSWSRFVSYNVESLCDADPLRRLGILTAAQSSRLRSVFETLSDRPFRFGLCHGDLALGNLLVDASGTVSLLDWGCAEANIVPHYDLIRLTEWKRTDPAAVRAFLDGYGIAPDELEAMAADLATLTMPKAVDLTRWALDRKPSVLHIHASRARRLVQEYLKDA
jgi:aminoglycoside phosphotransferase (APT) family kinase protein